MPEFWMVASALLSGFAAMGLVDLIFAIRAFRRARKEFQG
jgi:hypothetical protein